MKKTAISFFLAAALCLSLAACSGSSQQPASSDTQQQSAESTDPESSSQTTSASAVQTEQNKKVARDGADMQTEDKSMPTRVPMEGGTKINMYFGDTLIPGVLNDSETAKALIEKLPLTQQVNRYSHDFCGVTEDLPYNEDDVHYGWLNGDIDYAIDAPYFTILFEDEDVSEQYGYQVNIGVITCPLEEIAALDGSYEVRIELADEESGTTPGQTAAAAESTSEQAIRQ